MTPNWFQLTVSKTLRRRFLLLVVVVVMSLCHLKKTRLLTPTS